MDRDAGDMGAKGAGRRNRHRCRLTYTGRVTYYRTAASGSKELEKKSRELEELNEFLEEASAFFAANRRKSGKKNG